MTTRLEKTGATRSASRLARTAQRERSKRNASKDEKLKAKVEVWVGERIRQTLSSTESLLSELTARMEAKENSAIHEYQKLQSSIQTFEEKLRTSIRDQALPLAMQACRDELAVQRAQIDSELRSQIDLVVANTRDVREQQQKLTKDFQAFREGTDRRIVVFEKSGWQEGRDTLQNLEARFTDWVAAENDRDMFTRRLEAIVKELEGRTWPWRTHMDRSGSPDAHDSGAVRSASPNSRHPAKHSGEGAPQHFDCWRPWPNRGPIRPVPPTPRRSPPTSRPGSRPSSAGRKRSEVMQDGFQQRLHSVSTSSVSSGMPRTRPGSARERRSEADVLIS